jgi:hypothetical protein
MPIEQQLGVWLILLSIVLTMILWRGASES